MASEANLGILLSATDSASPVLKGAADSMVANKVAVRELAMGVSYLGMSFATMGIMLKQSNSELGQGIGNTMMMAGAIMTAVGSTFHFVKALLEISKALKNVAFWEAVVKAFEGPTGWIALGVGAAATVGIAGGMAAMDKSEKRSNTTVNIHNAGSVVTTKQIADDVRREIVKTQQRNNTSGIR